MERAFNSAILMETGCVGCGGGCCWWHDGMSGVIFLMIAPIGLLFTTGVSLEEIITGIEKVWEI